MSYKANSQWTWDFLMSFASRLQALRKEYSLTQRQLAELADVHVAQIRRYEAGDAQPTLTVIRNIAMGLHISADELAFDDNEREPSDDWKLQFEALSQFDDKEREVAKAVIDGLILRHTANRFSKAG